MDSYKYVAFISYKHSDEKWAKLIERDLEGYSMPVTSDDNTIKMKPVQPVFRDKTGLHAGELTEEIQSKLRMSEWLIVLCSRAAKKEPKYINQEIEYFAKECHGKDHIIPVVIDSSENPHTNCFPSSLIEVFNEPYANNIFEVGTKNALIKFLFAKTKISNLYLSGYRLVLIKIVSKILDKETKDLVDLEVYRVNVRRAYLCIFITILVIAFMAYRSFKNQEIQKEQALKMTEQARLLSAQAENALNNAEPIESIRLSLSAFDTENDNNLDFDTSEAQEILSRALNLYIPKENKTIKALYELKLDSSIVKIAYDDKEKYIAALDDMGNLVVWDITNGAECYFEDIEIPEGNEGYKIKNAVWFSIEADKYLICVNGFENCVYAVDLEKNRQLWNMNIPIKKNQYIYQCNFASMNDLIVVGEYHRENFYKTSEEYLITGEELNNGKGYSSGSKAFFYNIKTGVQLESLDDMFSQTMFSFSDEGRYFICEDVALDLKTGETINISRDIYEDETDSIFVEEIENDDAYVTWDWALKTLEDFQEKIEKKNLVDDRLLLSDTIVSIEAEQLGTNIYGTSTSVDTEVTIVCDDYRTGKNKWRKTFPVGFISESPRIVRVKHLILNDIESNFVGLIAGTKIILIDETTGNLFKTLEFPGNVKSLGVIENYLESVLEDGVYCKYNLENNTISIEKKVFADGIMSIDKSGEYYIAVHGNSETGEGQSTFRNKGEIYNNTNKIVIYGRNGFDNNLKSIGDHKKQYTTGEIKYCGNCFIRVQSKSNTAVEEGDLVSCYDAKTGELKWKHNDIKTIITCGDIIGLCSISNKVIVYDGISLSEIMEKPDGVIIAAGSDLLLKNSKSVECIDGHTKKIKWTSNSINEVLETSEYLGQFRQDMYVFCRFDKEKLILTLVDSKSGTIKKESSFLLSVEGDMYIDADVVLSNDGRILVPLQSEYGSYVYTYDFNKNSFVEVSDSELQSVNAVFNTASKYDTLNMKYINDYVLVLVNNNRPEIIWLDSETGELLNHTDLKYDGLFPGLDSASPCDMDIDFTPEGEYVVRISNSENGGNIDEIYIISHESQKLLAHISGGKAYNSNSNTIIIEDRKGNLYLAMKYPPDEIVKMGRDTLNSYYMNHK